jgi:hypothetical protein
MDIVYIFVGAGMKFREKEVPVWYTGTSRPISNTACIPIQLEKAYLFLQYMNITENICTKEG